MEEFNLCLLRLNLLRFNLLRNIRKYTYTDLNYVSILLGCQSFNILRNGHDQCALKRRNKKNINDFILKICYKLL